MFSAGFTQAAFQLTSLTVLNAIVGSRWKCPNQLIEQNGQGIIVWLDQEGKGNGHLAFDGEHKNTRKPDSARAKHIKKVGYEADARSFRPAAEVFV